jgi:hypothetical protein
MATGRHFASATPRTRHAVHQERTSYRRIDDGRSLKRRVARPGELELEEVRDAAMVLAQALPAHHG